jgi:hypothetical protein
MVPVLSRQQPLTASTLCHGTKGDIDDLARFKRAKSGCPHASWRSLADSQGKPLDFSELQHLAHFGRSRDILPKVSDDVDGTLDKLWVGGKGTLIEVQVVF